MAACEVCGNEYRLSFEVHAAGAVHTFDAFECAIHAFGAGVRAVRRTGDRPRRRGRRGVLLLRRVCPTG